MVVCNVLCQISFEILFGEIIYSDFRDILKYEMVSYQTWAHVLIERFFSKSWFFSSRITYAHIFLQHLVIQVRFVTTFAFMETSVLEQTLQRNRLNKIFIVIANFQIHHKNHTNKKNDHGHRIPWQRRWSMTLGCIVELYYVFE